jgi:flagellar motor switch protein FliN/FliY
MTVDGVLVDIAVVLGARQMTVREFINLSRGAVVKLDPSPSDLVEIRANNHLIARGDVVVKGDRVLIEISERVRAA